MIKIYKTDEINNTLNEISKLEIDSWINVVNPNLDEIKKLAADLQINENYLTKLIDEEEPAKLDIKDDLQLIIIDVPISIKSKSYSVSVTTPLTILQVRNEFIITICLKDGDILNDFIENKVPDFYTGKKSRFTFQIINKIASRYIKDLKTINQQINQAEEYMKKSTQNSDLLKLMHLRKSLVYFTTSLKSNEIILDRISKSNVITLYEEDKDVLESAIVEHKQAIEMAEIYNGLLNSTIDTFGTIISNNLNNVMKILAAFTIVISIPTMVASFMGMNIPLGIFSESNISFLIVIIISLILSILVAYILKKKNML